MYETLPGGHHCVSTRTGYGSRHRVNGRNARILSRSPSARSISGAGCEVNAMKSRFIPFDERSTAVQDFTHPRREGQLPERAFLPAAVTSADREEDVCITDRTPGEYVQTFPGRPHFGDCGGRPVMFTVMNRSDHQ
ncbi:hypothetical protein E5082_01825 [Streptomyces griseoluteus]|uniref:Uncharacterized protein n=1 Tax=Streptomyces griseoluteus TaxID=29306 RepID=A0A4Z1DNZ2_STRGP|nr:hypothetical protein [Streptomyces griseoluteus]TGN87185.1 hypothetical protein E5082_01825 [Streptomyces griseoluteus]